MINKRRMQKTASGTVLHDSTPAGIEQFLVNNMKEALGEWKNAVRVKPYLRIDAQDGDMSGHVKNAFGAIELTVHGASKPLYIPFIIADKTLLPFDTIRMGGEEVAYDYSKLRKLVNAIEHKVKSQQADDEGGGPFQTMEVADFKDIQPNNGFLGNIMAVRDMARQRDARGDYPWSGPEFGVLEDDRLMRSASTIDVLDAFHEVMEKIAEVKLYTPEQIKEYEDHIRKQANEEVMEEMEKTAAAPTMEEARVKRDMIQLSEEKLFDVRRAASGNDISFPIFCDGRLEYRSGRVYRNFRSWFEKDNEFTSGSIDALVLDNKGGYSFLKGNQPFMASVRTPGTFKLLTDQAKSLKVDSMYVLEDGVSTIYNPFAVKRSFLQDTLNDGIAVSVRELATKSVPVRTQNTMFFDVFGCQEIIPGKYKSDDWRTGSKMFYLIVSKDPAITKPTPMNEEELRNYITEHARDMQDARLALEMVMYNDTNILIPMDLSFFKTEKNIEGFYTRPDGLLKQGPMAKEASFDNLNKARLVVTNDRNPKSYSVQWQYADPADAGGVSAKRLQRHSADNLSRNAAQSMLGKLGFDYRTQAHFFEITERNGRSATFALPDIEKASEVAPPQVAEQKVEKKMNGLANSMLHSKNFMPMLANTVGDGLSLMLASAVPGSVTAANKMSNAFGFGKQSMETAIAMEKVASKINGKEWHELSALMNMKYRLDKLAEEITNGNYLYNAEPVFAKVAELKPVIEKKASDLIDFNRKQLLRTSSYIVEPELVKQALHQLDELSVYAGEVKKKEQMTKEAGIFRNSSKLSDARKAAANLEGNVNKLKTKFDNSHAKLRASLHMNGQGDKVDKAFNKAVDTQRQYQDGSKNLQDALHAAGDIKQKESSKNMAIAAGVGLPGLAGLGYAYQSEKNKKK